jgi:hypothetical protein
LIGDPGISLAEYLLTLCVTAIPAADRAARIAVRPGWCN